jgi:ERCC4-related helicase
MDILREEDPEYYEVVLEHEFIDSEITYNGENESNNKVEKATLDFLNQEKILRDFYNKLSAIPYDSKCQRLVELVEQIYLQNPQEKILIFTQFVDTLLYLKQLLGSQNSDYYIETF